MGLLDLEPEKTNKPYTFASGSIDGFIYDLSKPKEPQDIDENAGFDELNDLQPEPQREPLEQLQASSAVATEMASMIAITLDGSVSIALGLYANDDPKHYKAEPKEYETLETAIANYVKLKGGDIPPGFMLFLIILTIYGGKGVIAFQVHKLNKENAAKDKKIEELQRQLDTGLTIAE